MKLSQIIFLWSLVCVTLQSFKCFVAYIMLDFAGVFCCRIPINTEADEKIRKRGMPFIDFLRNRQACVGRDRSPS